MRGADASHLGHNCAELHLMDAEKAELSHCPADASRIHKLQESRIFAASMSWSSLPKCPALAWAEMRQNACCQHSLHVGDTRMLCTYEGALQSQIYQAEQKAAC